MLAFLDIMTYENEDKSIGHYIYRKPTHTNKYLNYNSYHPQCHKLGVIDTLFNRAFQICDKKHLEQEINYIIQILKDNEYPLPMILKRMKIVKNKNLHPLQPRPKDPDKRIILPWCGDVTNKLARFIRRKSDFEIGYTPGHKISTLVCNAKEKPPAIECGIYKFICQNCPDSYVGETGRNFIVRFNEHIKDVLKKNIISPVALHMMENSHEINHTSIKLITKEQRPFYRKFKESLYIRNTKRRMNTSKGLLINPIWLSTLIPFLNYR